MWIQQTTIGWLAYDLTGSGALLGTLQSVRNLPPLLTAPLAGVFADRYSRNAVVAREPGPAVHQRPGDCAAASPST